MAPSDGASFGCKTLSKEGTKGDITGTYAGTSEVTETLTSYLGLFSGDRFPGESMSFKCSILNRVEEVPAYGHSKARGSDMSL